MVDRPPKHALALSLSSLVRIETELLNRAQAAAAAEGEGERGGDVSLTALVALPLAGGRGGRR